MTNDNFQIFTITLGDLNGFIFVKLMFPEIDFMHIVYRKDGTVKFLETRRRIKLIL